MYVIISKSVYTVFVLYNNNYVYVIHTCGIVMITGLQENVWWLFGAFSNLKLTSQKICYVFMFVVGDTKFGRQLDTPLFPGHW